MNPKGGCIILYSPGCRKGQYGPENDQINYGRERGTDGLWRYETQNGKFKIAFDEILKNKGKALPLSDVLEDNPLFTAYPELKDFKIEFYDKKETGEAAIAYFSEPKKSFGVRIISNEEANSYLYGLSFRTFGKDWTDRGDYLLSSLYHEIQHHLHKVEGFASGGCIRDVLDYFVQKKIESTEKTPGKARQ